MAKFAKGLCLDLTNTLTGNVEFLAHLFQSAGAAVLDTKSQLQHLLLTGSESGEDIHQLLLEQSEAGGLAGLAGTLVGDEIAEMAVFLFADGGFQTDGLLRDLQNLADLVHGHIHFVGDLLGRGIMSQLLQELGHDPTPEEISAEMNMSVDKVREILKIAQEPVSLETPIGEEEDSHLGDFIPDEGASEPSEAASFTLLKEQLVDVLSTLTPREEKVLKLRFGIEDGRTRTLEEVGKEFNVTRERIRQIEAKALRKLRHPSRSKKLKDFLN